MPALRHAREELAAAVRARDALVRARDINELDTHWKAVIRHVERCWNKIVAEMRPNSRWQGWTKRGEWETLRSNDPLLSYIRNARGAEEHGVVDIAQKKPGSVGIGPATGNSLYIEKMTINNGVITELRSPQPVKITIAPATFELAAVLNRGVVYPVPREHLGRPLPKTDPVTIAGAAISYYSNVLAQIDEEWKS